jgi:hypothetical protein
MKPGARRGAGRSARYTIMWGITPEESVSGSQDYCCTRGSGQWKKAVRANASFFCYRPERNAAFGNPSCDIFDIVGNNTLTAALKKCEAHGELRRFRA